MGLGVFSHPMNTKEIGTGTQKIPKSVTGEPKGAGERDEVIAL